MDADMAKNIERAKCVKKQREERAWPQRQLADVANVSLRTIQRLEKDGSASFETLMAIAQAFGMDVKQLSPTSRVRDRASTQNRVHLLPRLASGKDLTNIVAGADQFQFEHDDDHDPRSIQAMKGILEMLKHDVVRLYDSDPTERLNVEDELSQEIEGLEGYGYYLFGIRRVIPKVVEGQSTLISMATLYMSHSRSPKVVRDKAFMVIPAVLPEIAH